ncbi:putative phosphoenolpyruvate carboxylase 4-like [Capsicum annuum]|uniref:DUF7054 domain-containing protein n=1 Tax=Capsicum annuum TaxID=4072 RepID=A0A1U8GD57_CAPAN|nr:uncharacterized protein At4g22758 [Capsicum annuum]KAF3653760.1 putative phosphoenolpyruvate carboxylase 4-like [Capsicum annuum]PHT83498.1 hypothetical protein T459_11941 [Capsicum annuum]
MLLYKPKKNQAGKGNRILISITVLGSAGPIRFVVNEEELVADVIDTALKSYAREGRLPVLGSDFSNFVLYCPTAGTEALSPWETIGALGVRNFMLFKKSSPVKNATEDGKQSPMVRKGAGSWKAWFNKSVSRKIVSHAAY